MAPYEPAWWPLEFDDLGVAMVGIGDEPYWIIATNHGNPAFVISGKRENVNCDDLLSVLCVLLSRDPLAPKDNPDGQEH